MNIVKAKEYGRGGAMEYGKGGKMPKELLDYFKKKQGKEYQDGGMAPRLKKNAYPYDTPGWASPYTGEFHDASLQGRVDRMMGDYRPGDEVYYNEEGVPYSLAELDKGIDFRAMQAGDKDKARSSWALSSRYGTEPMEKRDLMDHAKNRLRPEYAAMREELIEKINRGDKTESGRRFDARDLIDLDRQFEDAAAQSLAIPNEAADRISGMRVLKYQDGGKAPSAYLIPGYENIPDEQGMVSGRERMYVAIPGGEGSDPRVLDMRAAMRELGYDSPMEMARALGVQSSRGDRGFTFEGAQDPAYRRRMLAALGADSMEGLQDRLGIGRVDYERKRDLPNIMRASQGGM